MSPPALFIIRRIIAIWGKKRIVVRTKYDFRIGLELGAYLIEGYLYLGETNPLETRVLRTILQKGDNFFDIGANMGWYTLNASQVVGRGGKVVAFEPNPSVVSRLQENCKLNHIRNVTIVQAAVSDMNGSVVFWVGDSDELGSLTKENAAKGSIHGVKKMHVTSLTLDSYTQQVKFNNIRFMKIDTEGADLQVIHGARFTLKKFSPYLMVEVFGLVQETDKDRDRKILSYLKQLGYKPYEFTQTGLRPYQLSKRQSQLINLFFAKDDQELRMLGLLDI